MIINNLYYELELHAHVGYYSPFRPAPYAVNHDNPAFSDSGSDEDIEFELSVLLNVNGKLHIIPLEDMERVASLKPLVADIYRALVDEVAEEARKEYEKNSVAYALEAKS